jgi:hypothetical protein
MHPSSAAVVAPQHLARAHLDGAAACTSCMHSSCPGRCPKHILCSPCYSNHQGQGPWGTAEACSCSCSREQGRKHVVKHVHGVRNNWSRCSASDLCMCADVGDGLLSLCCCYYCCYCCWSGSPVASLHFLLRAVCLL